MTLYNSFLAYSYLCTKKIASHDFDAIKRTKTYIKFQSLLMENGLGCVPIHIELLNNKNDFRTDLHAFIRDLQFSVFKHSDNSVSDDHALSGVLIIDDLLSLGGNEAQISAMYETLYQLKIGTFVLENRNTSTGGYASQKKFQTILQSNISNEDRLEDLQLIPYSSYKTNLLDIQKMNLGSKPPRSGCSSTYNSIPASFPLIYWLYESYMIQESEALRNEFFFLSKNIFYKYCKMYEESEVYGVHEKAFHTFDFLLQDKPKRYGTLKPNFKNWLLGTNNESLADLSPEKRVDFSIPAQATEFTIQRYRLKAVGGKSSMSTASRRFYYPNAIEELKHIQNKIFNV